MSPPREITGKRPTNYSRWHRAKLPENCYMTDGDWFEQRLVNGEMFTIAFIETIQIPPQFVQQAQQTFYLWSSKEALMKSINSQVDFPCFVVRHTADCKIFCVSQINSNGQETEAIIMFEEEYKQWLVSLKIPSRGSEPIKMRKPQEAKEPWR